MFDGNLYDTPGFCRHGLSIGLVNQIPRCKQRGIKLATLQSSGVFDPRGIRQLAVQARPLGSLLAGINRAVFHLPISEKSLRCKGGRIFLPE